MDKKILVIGMNYIGDTLFTTPLLRELKNNFNNYTIDIVNGKNGIEILKNNPHIKNIIERPKNKESYKEDYKNYIEKLKKEKYDIGIAANTAFYAAYDLFISNVKNRVGLKSEAREIFLSKSTKREKHKNHIIDEILKNITLLNQKIENRSTEIFLTSKENEFGKNIMSKYKKALIIHAGATRISKRYPTKNFSRLINLIYKKEKIPIILIGGVEDKKLSEEIITNSYSSIAENFTGRFSIRETLSIIKNGFAFIGGDSAPLHIAASFNLYTLGIYGDTSPEVYGARGQNSINISSRNYCKNKLKLFNCEYIKRGCKTIECLNNLEPETLIPYIINFYSEH